MDRTRYVVTAALTALAVVVFVATLARATLLTPIEQAATSTPPAVSAFAAPGDYPARLRVPALGINAHVQETGRTASGAMGTPTVFADVAWYKYGPVPGQLGSAVIDGHVDNGLALAGVFAHLPKTQVGDELFVDTKDGRALRFVVTAVVSYPYDAVPTELIFNRADKPRLNLITCEGAWIPNKKTYDGRLVVFAELQ